MNQWLEHIGNSVHHLLPEWCIAAGFVVLLLLGIFRVKEIFLAATAATCLLVSMIILPHGGATEPLFGGMLVADERSYFFRILIDLSALFTIFMGRSTSKKHPSEYYALILCVILGAHVLTLTTHALMIFLAIEMMSICSYILVASNFNREGTEASMKYFLFGAVSSAAMLYGLSFFYGLSGTLDISSPKFIALITQVPSDLFYVAALLVLAGLLYKIAAFPMHLWAPDAYEGAPLSVIALLAVAPKVAGFAILIKFTMMLHVSASASMADWQLMLAFISMITLTVGNFAALFQKSVKRLMAYSSIAHSGFLLIAMVTFLPHSIENFIFYAFVYLTANVAVFLQLHLFEKVGATTIAAFSGYGRHWVLSSVLLTISLITLTGLPPTAGFTSKLLIFSALWEAYQATGKSFLLILLIFGLLNTVVSLFYYLRIPYFAYLKKGDDLAPQNLMSSQNFLSLILVLAVLIVFFQPQLLMGWINKINFVH